MGRIWQIACFLVLALPAFAAGGSCPSGNNAIDPNTQAAIPLANVGITGEITGSITSCFYASKQSGASDSNNGTSESTPWLHIPGQSGCSANCAATTPTAGEAFILRGGDTWTATTDMNGLSWAYSGNSSHVLYVGGGDLTWYNSSVCGASYCRPIFNANSVTTNNMFNLANVNWNVIDNIEVTGMQNNINGCQMVSGSNSAAHGFTFTAGRTPEAATTSDSWQRNAAQIR